MTKSTLSFFRGQRRRLHRLGAAFCLGGLGILSAATANAQTAGRVQAGTTISTQATVSFVDSSGSTRQASSTVVTVSVSQVYAATLQGTGNTVAGGAGTKVFSLHTLTNSGNGLDTFNFTVGEATGGSANSFSNIEVFEDDGTGRPRGATPLCTASAGVCTVSALPIAAGTSLRLVVAYTIGTNWTSTLTNTATVSFTSATKVTEYASTTPLPQAKTDTVNVSTGAEFVVTKAIGTPGFSRPDGTAWPVRTSGPLGTQFTYTYRYQNNGAAPGTVYIRDALPTGLTYQTGTAVHSCNTAAALSEGNADETTLCPGVRPDYRFNSTTGTMELVVPDVAVNTSGTLSFVVQVTAGATVGTNLGSDFSFAAQGCRSASGPSNTQTDCTSANTTLTTVPSGTLFGVIAARRVELGTKDTTAGTPGATDKQTIAAIGLGRTQSVPYTIKNDGTARDTFNLTVTPGTLPAGTVFRWTTANDVDLSDTNSDDIVDTGPIEAGASVSYRLYVTVPSTTTLIGSTALSGVVRATSINDSTAFDASGLEISSINGGLVDLTANPGSGAVGAGPGPGSAAAFSISNVEAGTVRQIDLLVRNNESTSSTYNLLTGSTSQLNGALPTGWTVTYGTANCADTARVTATSLTVPGNTTTTYFACVSVPANAPSGTQSLYFGVVKQGATNVSDSLYVNLSLFSSNEYALSLSGGGNANLSPGGRVTLAFTLGNAGLRACAASPNRLRVQVTLAGQPAGWTNQIYQDNNGDGLLDANDTLVTDGLLATDALAVNGSRRFLVRIDAPSFASNGDVVNVTVRAEEVNASNTVQTAPAGCGTVTSQAANLTVSNQNLSVVKTQAKQSAVNNACPTYPLDASFNSSTQNVLPGDCVYYQVVVTNQSGLTVRNVSINDAAPAFTTLQTTPAGSCTASTTATGTFTFSNPSGSSVACSSGANNNTLPAAATLTLRFAVRVND